MLKHKYIIIIFKQINTLYVTLQNTDKITEYLVRIPLWTNMRVLINATTYTKSTPVSKSTISIKHLLTSLIHVRFFVQYKWNLCQKLIKFI